jgi:hypothetical protein
MICVNYAIVTEGELTIDLLPAQKGKLEKSSCKFPGDHIFFFFINIKRALFNCQVFFRSVESLLLRSLSPARKASLALQSSLLSLNYFQDSTLVVRKRL